MAPPFVGCWLLAVGCWVLTVVVASAAEPPAAPAAPQGPPSPYRIAFPGIVTPYGIALAIALLTTSMDARRTTLILGLLAGVLVLDLLAMLFADAILRTVGWLLAILGAVLIVLQIALALQMMLVGLRGLGLLSPLGN